MAKVYSQNQLAFIGFLNNNNLMWDLNRIFHGKFEL